MTAVHLVQQSVTRNVSAELQGHSAAMLTASGPMHIRA